jgi:predicted protein tyrosine phosphatase
MPTLPALPPLSLLTICGLAELGDHGKRAVTHVLSIIDPGWPDPAEAFGAYDPHDRTTLRFHDAIEPAADIVLPTPEDIDAVLRFGRAMHEPAVRHDAHVLVHCHMGISRSTAAMATLIAQADPDIDEDALFARLADVRPKAWPNSLMIGFADAALGRQGRLTAALGRHYARQLGRFPDTAAFMNANSRAREVAMAQAGARELGLPGMGG